MTWYTITLFLVIVIYIEITRKRQNNKVTEDIRSVKKDVNYQLEMIRQMLNDDEGTDKPFMPEIIPKVCRTDKQRVVRFNNAILAEKKEEVR